MQDLLVKIITLIVALRYLMIDNIAMSKPDFNHARQLYRQCQEAYERSESKSETTWTINGRGIPSPSEFDDLYNVPSILLFQELCRTNRNLKGKFEIFRENLLLDIFDKKAFDYESLSKVGNSSKFKSYKVYFEVYLQKRNTTPLPFEKVISIKGLKFKWCNQKAFAKIYNDHTQAQAREFGFRETNLDHDRLRYFPSLSDSGKKNIYPIVVEVMANTSLQAVSKALSIFEIAENSINVVQNIDTRSVYHLGKPPSNNVLVKTGITFTVDSSETVEVFQPDQKIYKLPNLEFKFTNSQNKIKLFHYLIHANCSNTAISQRILAVTKELNLAYSTDDLGLRQLSYWRCLELATAKNGSSRKEKEIIQIFQNYYSNEAWKQMGETILKLRNTYVHRGELLDENDFFENYYLNWAKQYAEASLRILLYLFKNRSKWKKAADINKFFDYYIEPDEYLKLASELLKARYKN